MQKKAALAVAYHETLSSIRMSRSHVKEVVFYRQNLVTCILLSIIISLFLTSVCRIKI